MSRPKLPPEKLKSVRVLVRLTPDQAQKVRELRDAEEGQPGVSTLLRNIIMSAIAGSAA
jgi:hypothetical protein